MEQYGVLRFYNKKYLKTTLILIYIWFAKGFVQAGITFILPQTLGTNDENEVVIEYLKTLALEIPIGIIVVLAIDLPYFGRKNSSFYAFLLAAAPLWVCIFKSPDGVFVYLVAVAAGFTWAQGNLMNVYTTEYYPTKIRNTSLGHM